MLPSMMRTINFSAPIDKGQHDKMVSLVARILALHQQSPRTLQEQELVKSEIDILVYGLYGLTEEEIKIVERK